MVAGCGQEATPGTGSLTVAVGYADTRTDPPPHTFPSPWSGAPGVRFVGSGQPFNAGAIRFDNASVQDLHLDRVVVKSGAREWSPWGGGQLVPAHGSLILTQTAGANFAPSGAGASCSAPSNAVPMVLVSAAGQSMTLRDEARILSTGGRDATCGGGNASHPWVEIGSVPASEEVSAGTYRDLAGWALLGLLGVALLTALVLGAATALRPRTDSEPRRRRSPV